MPLNDAGGAKHRQEEELELAMSSANLAKQIIIDGLQSEKQQLQEQLDTARRYAKALA